MTLKCLYEDIGGFNVVVFVGPPGTGKSTLALNLVAYALHRDGKCADWDSCRYEAAKRLFLGSSVAELAEFLLSIIETNAHDYVILDDAALGFWDVSHPTAWARLMDVIKIARNAIATKMLIFTTTSRQFLSKRVVSMARVYYVTRDKVFAENAGACWRPAQDPYESRLIDAQIVSHISSTLRIKLTTSYSRVDAGLYARVAAVVPLSKEYAMPHAIEASHIAARKERAAKALRDVIAIIHKKEGEREE